MRRKKNTPWIIGIVALAVAAFAFFKMKKAKPKTKLVGTIGDIPEPVILTQGQYEQPPDISEMPFSPVKMPVISPAQLIKINKYIKPRFIPQDISTIETPNYTFHQELLS